MGKIAVLFSVYIFASGSVFLTNPVSVLPAPTSINVSIPSAHIFFNVSSNLTLEEA